MQPSRAFAPLVLCLLAGSLVACRARWALVDGELAASARGSMRLQEFPALEEFEEHDVPVDERGTVGDAIVAELLAIFPGILIHGAGHFYAGDRDTAAQLSRVGQLGYLAAAAGAGIVYGGVVADDEDQTGLAISLYSTGGVIGGAGVLYLLTAWFYDMIDAPRAALSGGRPPPRSKFVESLDLFGD